MSNHDTINTSILQLLRFSGDVFVRIRFAIRSGGGKPDVDEIHALADACENLQSLAAGISAGRLDEARWIAGMLLERFTDTQAPWHQALGKVEALPLAIEAMRSLVTALQDQPATASS